VFAQTRVAQTRVCPELAVGDDPSARRRTCATPRPAALLEDRFEVRWAGPGVARAKKLAELLDGCRRGAHQLGAPRTWTRGIWADGKRTVGLSAPRGRGTVKKLVDPVVLDRGVSRCFSPRVAGSPGRSGGVLPWPRLLTLARRLPRLDTAVARRRVGKAEPPARARAGPASSVGNPRRPSSTARGADHLARPVRLRHIAVCTTRYLDADRARALGVPKRPPVDEAVAWPVSSPSTWPDVPETRGLVSRQADRAAARRRGPGELLPGAQPWTRPALLEARLGRPAVSPALDVFDNTEPPQPASRGAGPRRTCCSPPPHRR